MYPTVGQIKTQYLGLLDDPTAAVFVQEVWQTAFNEAVSVLNTAFLTNQCPRIELITSYAHPAGVTSFTPADAGITDFSDFILLRERRYGSNDRFIEMIPCDMLPQRQMGDRLREYSYRNDTFYVVGATVTTEIEIKYDGGAQAPTNDTDVVMVDNVATFLSNYAVGVSGGRKGYEEIAARCMMLAVGPKYDQGTIGGELFRIIQHRVRSRQKVQIAPKPFSANRRMWVRRAVPFVAAQQGTTGGTGTNVPVQYSTAPAGGQLPLAGAVNGANTVFVIPAGGVKQVLVTRNGLTQTQGLHYSWINNQITFATAPLAGDVVTIDAFF